MRGGRDSDASAFRCSAPSMQRRSAASSRHRFLRCACGKSSAGLGTAELGLRIPGVSAGQSRRCAAHGATSGPRRRCAARGRPLLGCSRAASLRSRGGPQRSSGRRRSTSSGHRGRGRPAQSAATLSIDLADNTGEGQRAVHGDESPSAPVATCGSSKFGAPFTSCTAGGWGGVGSNSADDGLSACRFGQRRPEVERSAKASAWSSTSVHT